MTYSNNFSFDYLNLCKICNISPHPDIIKLYYYKLINFLFRKSNEEIEKCKENISKDEQNELSNKSKTAKPGKPKSFSIDDYLISIF